MQSCDDTHLDNVPVNHFGFDKMLKSNNTSYVVRDGNLILNEPLTPQSQEQQSSSKRQSGKISVEYQPSFGALNNIVSKTYLRDSVRQNSVEGEIRNGSVEKESDRH